MRIGRSAGDYVAVLEASYADASGVVDWMERVMDALDPAMTRGVGTGLVLVREPGEIVYLAGRGMLADPEMKLRFMEPVRHSSPPTYRHLMYTGRPVSMFRSLAADVPAEERAHFEALMMPGADVLGAHAFPAPGLSAVVYSFVPDGRPPEAAERQALTRVSLHVEAGIRLLSRDVPPAAVFTPDGRVVDQETDCFSSSEATERLRDRVRTIDDARRSSRRLEPEALDAWKALCEGRWSLVERVDRDGRRHYLAFENLPWTRQHRALTQREAVVVHHALRGLSGKQSAYSLGVNPGSVSRLLQSAAQKLGVRRRDELLRLAAGLHAPTPCGPSASGFTTAEREVLALLREGLGNEAIAAKRGTSPATVANQVASLLRKSGAASRRALIVGASNADSLALSVTDPSSTDAAPCVGEAPSARSAKN